MMNSINWHFLPAWNVPMPRKDFILNYIVLTIFWLAGGMFYMQFSTPDQINILTTLLAVAWVLLLLYTFVITIVWTNNRLRDGGLSSEGYRIAVIALSFIITFLGCLTFIYCCVKPTEDPAILIDEGDDDNRDEGPR